MSGDSPSRLVRRLQLVESAKAAKGAPGPSERRARRDISCFGLLLGFQKMRCCRSLFRSVCSKRRVTVRGRPWWLVWKGFSRKSRSRERDQERV